MWLTGHTYHLTAPQVPSPEWVGLVTKIHKRQGSALSVPGRVWLPEAPACLRCGSMSLHPRPPESHLLFPPSRVLPNSCFAGDTVNTSVHMSTCTCYFLRKKCGVMWLAMAATMELCQHPFSLILQVLLGLGGCIQRAQAGQLRQQTFVSHGFGGWKSKMEDLSP